MSGGHFDYGQSRIEWEIARPIMELILRNKTKPDYLNDDSWEGQMYSDDTIVEFYKGLEALRRAYVYAQRIDWLVSGDDGEPEFHKRLEHDLKNYHFELPTSVSDDAD